MKQLGYLVVSVSLLLAVIVTRGPDSQLSASRVAAPATGVASDLSDLEVAIGWAVAGSLLAAGLMGGLVYRFSLREFEAWTESRPRTGALAFGTAGEQSRFGRMEDPRDARAA